MRSLPLPAWPRLCRRPAREASAYQRRIGLGTRFAALGLLLMTAVIQLTVPEGWAIHLTWAAMALALIRYGGGGLSVDRAAGLEASRRG